ncbi:unnamed protein product [Menidia menidia]|uniref:(Atlantic silverside) hypothetical protein n=1 Tax=Menidia menidia TaxID=238744 RepID=A0A8S4AZR4_9TELE|nr:unnamed protein product [Menidia menidia]
MHLVPRKHFSSLDTFTGAHSRGSCLFSSGELTAEMGPSATSVGESENHKMFKTNGDAVSLPKHSYWFDFWVFVLFDIALFIFIYFIVP